MTKYTKNCYTCEHCQKETCKGCHTLSALTDDEVYENWELRHDLEEKDTFIKKLKEELDNLKFVQRNIGNLIKQLPKETYNKVLNEIKLKLKNHCDFKQNIGWYITEEKLDKLIDTLKSNKTV